MLWIIGKQPFICRLPPQYHSMVHSLWLVCYQTCILRVTSIAIFHHLLISGSLQCTSSCSQMDLSTLPGLLTPLPPCPHFPRSPAQISGAMMAAAPLPTAQLSRPSPAFSGLPGKCPVLVKSRSPSSLHLHLECL